jgi:adenosylcobyric acid synthase
VAVRWASEPAELVEADVVVIPGSKATVADLQWLRDRGLADAIVAHAGRGGVVLGICGGMQMLCHRIDDGVESGRGSVAGLGLLDADIVFESEKVLRRWEAAADGLDGYEIHHGRVVRCAEDAWFEVRGSAQGFQRDSVFATHWHGLLDNDGFRRGWLARAAEAAGRTGFRVAPDTSVASRRDGQLDLMADLLDAHLDLDAMLALLDGPPPDAPIITTGVGGLP